MCVCACMHVRACLCVYTCTLCFLNGLYYAQNQECKVFKVDMQHLQKQKDKAAEVCKLGARLLCSYILHLASSRFVRSSGEGQIIADLYHIH